MNYGLLNFKAQNGKPQIFYSTDKVKKPDRKFGYKSRDQRFNIRQYPTDLRTDDDNLLQPIEPPPEEKPKKPAKNFIKRNRELLAKKKGQDSTVTLTQEQLNAILASVGKVATGKEDALRISIDADKNVIKVESPRRDDDGDHKHRHRDRRKKDEEDSIFALVDDKKSRRRERTPERSDSGDRYRSRKHSGDRDHHRKHSSERDHHRKHSSDRHYRNHSNDRYRDDSEDRHRRHSRDRHRHRSISPEDRYRTPSRERRRHSPEERSRRRHSREDRSRERRRHSSDDRSRERRRHSPDNRHRRDSAEGRHHRRRSPEPEESKKEQPKENNPPSPREIAGIPVSLPWKHMTKAERRRLLLAREKVVAEETRKEEEEKKKSYQELESKIQKGFKRDDYRRDDRQDNYRREHDTSKVNDTPSSLNTFSSSSLPPANGRLSLGELKRRQWEKERADTSTAGEFQPWGRPGAGAPIRTKSGNIAADYNKRKDVELERVDEEGPVQTHYTPPRDKRPEYTESRPVQNDIPDQVGVPAAMRSSIVFGKGADAESALKTKELERQKWVQELDKQREEKRLREVNELNTNRATDETWADKFSNPYRPAPLPDQNVKQYGPEEHLLTNANADNRRTSSAPNQSETARDEGSSYIRGQNVFMDPVTQKEMEDKRKKHLEHQQAIMEQVQEKQRQKQLEKERKMKEDMEEEMKLQRERERQQKIFDAEIQKNKAREVRRQQQVENLKAAMDEAHENAQREKYQRRMQHLEEAGHDVSNLKANLQEQQTTRRYNPTETAREFPTTSRDQFFTQHYYSHNMADILTGGRLVKLTPRATEPTYVPGLNLEVSPRPAPHEPQVDKQIMALDQYTENRVLTPSQYRHGHSPKREFGTQTANLGGAYSETVRGGTYREMTDIDIMYKPRGNKKVRVRSATKEEKMPKRPPVAQYRQPSQKENREPKQSERQSRDQKKKGKDLWNYQNKQHRRPVKQSEKDLNQHKRAVSEHRRRVREQELLTMVEKNKDRIPTERLSRLDSYSDGELTPRTDRLCRRHKSHSPEGQPEVNRLVIDRSRSRSRSPEVTGNELVPFKQRTPSPAYSLGRNEEHYTRAPSPPVPALKHKMGGEGFYDRHGKLSKYGDGNPATVELGESDFVPFTRTVEILNPAMATEPLPLSREATQVSKARKAYIKGMKPGNYGNRVDSYEDRIKLPGDSNNYDKDPITNPSLVKNHPTQRQDQILNQLSSLKESLIQRQRELETFSPTDLE